MRFSLSEANKTNDAARKEAMSVKEAAFRLDVAEITLRRKIYAGEFPAKKFGARTLVLRTDLEDFLNKLPAAA